MEEYMKALLEQIRCKPAKKLVEQEIRGHILEQYEENLDKGMEETLAMEGGGGERYGESHRDRNRSGCYS